MKKCLVLLEALLLVSVCIAVLGCQDVQTRRGEDTGPLGPQSTQARGELRVLMAAVRFPDAEPTLALERTRRRAVQELDQYVREQSYGLAWVKADFRGWVRLPDSLEKYKVSPYNFKVDRSRVRKLVEDTMTAIEREVDFSNYDHMLIIPGVLTTPGKGYGMICYCANPGMLTGVRREPAFVTLKSKGGKEFRGGVFVGAENVALGMFAHDFFHALGGVQGGRRLVPCLYDFESQSDESRPPTPEVHALYMGAWDIMSEHFIKRNEPPQGLSSFTRIRLGWITAEQAVIVRPGDTTYAFLSPLAKGGETLVVKVPLSGGQYYLVENRQPVGSDRILPDAGLLVLKVNPEAREGTGTVKIMDADPAAHHFSRPTFKLGGSGKNHFEDRSNKVVILPLWSEGDRQGVLVTTPDKGKEALDAALQIQKLLNRFPEPRPKGRAVQIEKSQASFKSLDFKAAAELARKGMD
ncbi:MAG: hypothetical protein AB1512_07890 [Thermodesulfobacteriota bacterium]